MTKKSQKQKKVTYTPASIVKMVDNKRDSQAFREWLDQMDADFDLFALERYTAEEGRISYTSPAARNDFMKVYYGLNKASLTWQVVVPDTAPQEARDQANRGEALLSGILAETDRHHRALGEPPLREAVGWIACGRGAVAIKCLIYNEAKQVEEAANTEFTEPLTSTVDIAEWDPMHMAFEKGATGLVWVSYEYTVTKDEAQERWGVEIAEDDARVIDFFDRHINAVVLAEGKTEGQSQFVKKPTEHNLGHVPVFIGFPGGMPTVYTKDKQATLKYRAASVYASSRNIYAVQNKQISFIMDTAEKSVAGSLVHRIRGGTALKSQDPWGSFSVTNLDIDKEETLEPLKPPEVPKESAVILGLLDRDKQESTVPYPTGYGLDPQAHSGAALAMMNDNTRSVYGPFTSLMEGAYTWLCEEILGQFKAKGQKMQLKGFDQQGKFFILDASPDEIDPSWYITVKCEPKLPRDEQGEMQMALAATSPRGPEARPLLDDLTVYEKILKLQNPDAIIQRIDDQKVRAMINAHPSIVIRKAALALLEQGDRWAAIELLQSLPSPVGGGPPGAGGAPPGAMVSQGGPPGGGAMPPGVGTAPGQVPPEVAAQMEAEVAQMAAQKQQGGMPA